MNKLDLAVRIKHYRRSCRRGTDWLLKQMKDDGAVGPVEDRLHYYRLPWTLALMGEVGAANRTLDWIRDHMLSDSGALEGISPQGIFNERYGSYPLACLLVGAVIMQRFDVVYPGIPSLIGWQDPESGGVYNTREDMSETGEQELFPTAQYGMTMILVNRIDEAILAGQWMKRVWELQPDTSERLHHVYTRASGVVTDVPTPQDSLYITRKNDPWQHHFNGGIAAAFLSNLYMATRDGTWLDLAREYQAFSMTSDPVQFQSMQTCKSGWGSGLLYAITRDKVYYYWTTRLGDWFVSHQYTDGHWENTHYLNPVLTDADNIEITAEFVMHLAHIISNVSLPRE